jgi:uncharacterized heparinase superfamily protein
VGDYTVVMKKIKTALISVSDKKNLKPLLNILRKNPNKQIKFDIRFHLDPNSKVMKTQDNKSILIELGDEGWRFSCDNFDISIDNSLYFGHKNSYKDNQNIFISGMNKENEQIIKWEIIKL